MENSDTPYKKHKYLVSLGAYDGNLFGVQLHCDLSFMTNAQPVTEDKKAGKNSKDEDYLPIQHDEEVSQAQKEAKLLKRGFFSKNKFAFKAMEGSIRCLSNNGHYLALGGYEEVIKLFNIRKYVEVGELVDHEGTITCLEFYKDDYLISGSEDGEIFLWRVKDFVLIHKLRVPKSSAVIDIAVHPTGKLCLAVYKSSHLVLWDLTKGKNKLKKKVRDDVVSIKWDKQGAHYLILCQKSIAVFSITQDKPISIINFEDRVNDFDFIDKSIIQTVNEDDGEGESEQSENQPQEENDDVSSTRSLLITH